MTGQGERNHIRLTASSSFHSLDGAVDGSLQDGRGDDHLNLADPALDHQDTFGASECRGIVKLDIISNYGDGHENPQAFHRLSVGLFSYAQAGPDSFSRQPNAQNLINNHNPSGQNVSTAALRKLGLYVRKLRHAPSPIVLQDRLTVNPCRGQGQKRWGSRGISLRRPVALVNKRFGGAARSSTKFATPLRPRVNAGRG